MNTNGFDKVYDTIKTVVLNNSEIGDVNISTTTEGSKYPKIVVSDIENSIASKTTGNMESISLIGIEINIYAKTKKVNGSIYTGRMQTRHLAKLVDVAVSDICGMSRITARAIDNADPQIDRYIMRYNGYQHDQRGFFY